MDIESRIMKTAEEKVSNVIKTTSAQAFKIRLRKPIEWLSHIVNRVKDNDANVPMHQCANAPMRQCANAPIRQCANDANVPMCQCANAPMRQCANAPTTPMCQCANAPTTPMCQCANAPMHQCANAPMRQCAKLNWVAPSGAKLVKMSHATHFDLRSNYDPATTEGLAKRNAKHKVLQNVPWQTRDVS